MFNNPVLKKIADKYEKSVAQVILRWLTQRGVVALAKSINVNRMKENISIFDFKLSEEDMNTIKELDTKNSLFFNHQDPRTVDIFVKFVEERSNMD